MGSWSFGYYIEGWGKFFAPTRHSRSLCCRSNNRMEAYLSLSFVSGT